MKPRQQQLLATLVELYVKWAQPIASGLLVKKTNRPISSATIRNEMAELESQGFIIQPHTSAGRIPTEKGYQFYVDHFIKNKQPDSKTKTAISQCLAQSRESRQQLKNIAKKIAELTDNTVIVAFANNDIYYTGLSNLFAQPEFHDQHLVVSLSKVIDHLDQVIYDLFDRVDRTQIKIGNQCGFGSNCSAIVGQYHFQDTHGLLTVLGPMRMAYGKNFNLVDYVVTLKKYVKKREEAKS